MKANGSEEKKALERIAKLKRLGYNTFPADSPFEGKKGFYAIKGDLEELIEWPLFNSPPAIDSKHVSVDEFSEVIKDPRYFSCDNPKQLCLGAVRYNFTKNTITVRLCSISKVKNLGSDNATEFTNALARFKKK